MKIMSVNAGSSSLKFSLFNMEDKTCIASGYFERVGIENSFYTIKYNGEKIREEVSMPDHTAAVEVLLDRLVSIGILTSLDEIEGIGHRVVHGYTSDKPVIIDDNIISDIERFSSLAPLHNPANILGINACRKALPNVPMVAVYDTAFHQTMAKDRYLYPVPYAWYEKYGVRKYGFHGTSHQYVTKKLTEILGRNDLRIIICHLGSGCSISAVKNGKCIDTTMGFTPLPGVMMGTRSGDIDPSIIPYIMEQEGLNAKEVVDILNKKSGCLGVSEKYSDHRDIETGIAEGDEQCILANKMFNNSVIKYISEYYVALGGCDVLAFTAGVGENSIETRKEIVSQLSCLQMFIDEEKNNTRGEIKEISSDHSNTKIYVVPTNEELMIAEETLALMNR